MTCKEAINEIIQNSNGNRVDGGFSYTFLIGAGASVSSHIPDGVNMCKKLQKKYKIKDKAISDNLKYNIGFTRYQSVFNLVKKLTHEKFISKHIRDIISTNARRPKPDYRWIINNCYNTLANILIDRSFFSRTIFTTNFDPLLYYAFIQNWNTEPVLIRHYEELETMQPKQVYNEFPSLIYLHGYWQNHYLYHEPGDIVNNIKNWVDRLTEWLEHDIIVLGYSGLEDSIAIEWLRKCLVSGRTVWWCIYSPNGTIDNNYCQLIKNKIKTSSNKINFFPIISADQFALELGKQLNLRQSKEIFCLSNIFLWFHPNSISLFVNGAILDYKTNKDFIVTFKMGKDKLPGNNHAGINIDSVEYELDISQYKEIVIDYTLLSINSKINDKSFEFKLHSTENAWSYHVPIEDRDLCVKKNIKISLAEYTKNDVNLKKIWRIVIAADVKCLGEDGEAKIAISKVIIR